MTAFTALFKKDAFTPDQLVAGNPALLLNASVIVLAGQNLARGALLGKITASGKYVLSLAAASDGSQVPAAILVDDVNATSADTAALIYTRGDFLADAVTYGAGHTAASVAAALKAQSIYLITSQGGV